MKLLMIPLCNGACVPIGPACTSAPVSLTKRILLYRQRSVNALRIIGKQSDHVKLNQKHSLGFVISRPTAERRMNSSISSTSRCTNVCFVTLKTALPFQSVTRPIKSQTSFSFGLLVAGRRGSRKTCPKV